MDLVEPNVGQSASGISSASANSNAKNNSSGPRPRTQTHSQIHRLKQQDHLKKKSGSNTAAKKPVKKVWGSITLPVFCFEVVTTDVTAHLLHQNSPKFKKHQWATVLINNNNPVSKDESEKVSEPSQNEKIEVSYKRWRLCKQYLGIVDKISLYISTYSLISGSFSLNRSVDICRHFDNVMS